MKRILQECELNAEQLNNVRNLASELNLCVDTVKILYGRGVDDREKIVNFLNPSKNRFISPFKMSGMSQACELIKTARDEGWCVVVYGDYDADGICACTIMGKALEEYGIKPVLYVPERKTGYGLNKDVVDEIFEEYFPQLFITVDCGISNREEVEYIKEQGAEVIVTDHHELPDTIPDCICINPKFNDGYIYDNLCGAGVAFKVACALNGKSAYSLCDFAAIATIADSVPLTGENRDIVYEGLKIINRSPRPCYARFLQKGQGEITASGIAFSIAPKINAAGRMGDADCALRLFTSCDENEIFELSAKLVQYNLERQACCDELYRSAKEKIRLEESVGKVIMLWDENWNNGFVGIVAAKLCEEYGKPTLLFVKNGDMLKGSARSIEGVNIFEALKACENYIDEFGGHSQAAGVNISVENFIRLKTALNDYLYEKYPAESFMPTLYVNGTLADRLNAKFVHEVEALEPFGVGNRRPLFVANTTSARSRLLKADSPHVATKINDLEMMYFYGARFLKLMQSAVQKKVVFEYNVSNFRGKEQIKGFIKDVVYDGSDVVDAANEIDFNNACRAFSPTVNVMFSDVSSSEINAFMLDKNDYGTVYIASEVETIKKYSNANKLNVNLFTLSAKGGANVILLSPEKNTDLSSYTRVCYLDSPLKMSLNIADGVKIYVCRDIKGDSFVKKINSDRGSLIDSFKKISTAYALLQGVDVETMAQNGMQGIDNLNLLFALEVFEELGILKVDGGKLVVYKGVKTELTLSERYNLINGQITDN